MSISELPEGIKYSTTSDSDAVLTTRVRLARNVSGFPFPIKADKAQREKIADIAVNAAQKVNPEYDFKILSTEKFTPAQLNALAEKRLISSEFINSNGGTQGKLIADDKHHIYIMVNEEDHLRIQSMHGGLALDEAYAAAGKCDNFLEETIDYAFDEKLGYLTECPTNLGTGMRASVMLHLPILAAQNKIRAISANLIKLGLVMRGCYGEGSDGKGNLYQISNQITLGVTEEQTLEKLKNVTAQIIQLERGDRALNYKNAEIRFKDRIYRSYGILKNAYVLPISEFFNLYSDIRLGISLGLIDDISYTVLDKLLTDVMPANLTLLYDSEGKNINLDIIRAEAVKNII